jgi:hypothetical protein
MFSPSPATPTSGGPVTAVFEASLLSHAADLDQALNDRYPDEQLTDDFRQRYLDERAALRDKARSAS